MMIIKGTGRILFSPEIIKGTGRIMFSPENTRNWCIYIYVTYQISDRTLEQHLIKCLTNDDTLLCQRLTFCSTPRSVSKPRLGHHVSGLRIGRFGLRVWFRAMEDCFNYGLLITPYKVDYFLF
jgi:hypothetical protein